MTTSQLLRNHLMKLRSAQGLVEVTLLDPSTEVLNAIRNRGGEVGHYSFIRWCNNDTCRHYSHSEGQSETTVYVPKAWIDDSKDASPVEWNYDYDNAKGPVMVLPPVNVEDEAPLLVLEQDNGYHYAKDTIIVGPRPITLPAPTTES